MIMSDTELTELQQIIYDALLKHGDYMTRSDIAQVIGRDKTLNHYDRELLQQLVDMGLVDVLETKRGVTMTSYTYKAINN
ncbi:MAG: hypothetical protein Pars93KO_26610 [Parasphingorhabdus sp.]